MKIKKELTRKALSVKNATCHYLFISGILLLVYLQMLTCLVYSAGVFVLSNELLISPFRFCQARQGGELFCSEMSNDHLWGAESVININIVTTLVKVCLYVPVVLVAFALLAMVFAAYAKDRSVASLSMVCQAASTLLTLAGMIVFLLFYRSYLSWKDMGYGFYICVSVQVELAITTVLTYVTGRRLTAEWD